MLINIVLCVIQMLIIVDEPLQTKYLNKEIGVISIPHMYMKLNSIFMKMISLNIHEEYSK